MNKKRGEKCFCTQCGTEGINGQFCTQCGNKLGKSIKSRNNDNIENNVKIKGGQRITSITPLTQHPNQPVTIHGIGFGIKKNNVKVLWIGFREELKSVGRVIDDNRIETRIPRKAVISQTYDVIVETAFGNTKKFGYTLGGY